MKNKLDGLVMAMSVLKIEADKLGIKVEKILVDKTLPIKYELSTGKDYNEEPRVPCDPFSTLIVGQVKIIGRDNEKLRMHPEWPAGEKYSLKQLKLIAEIAEKIVGSAVSDNENFDEVPAYLIVELEDALRQSSGI